MATLVTPLTNTQIKNAKPKDKEYNLCDGQGLLLRIRPSGSKAWLFNYRRPKDNKRTNISIGKYPSVTLLQARKKRNEFLSLLTQGTDPNTNTQKNEIKDPILIEVSKDWFQVKRDSITADYAHDIWRSLEMHVFPKIGELPVSKITPQIVISTLSPLAEKGSLESVKRVCQRLNEIMVFSVNTGLIPYNTISGVKHAFKKPKSKHMSTLKPEELGGFMVDLMNSNIRRVTRLLILWQLHTMCRPAEASSARWSEIDWKNKLWTIAPERMKKRREHSIPLTPQAIQILEQAKVLNSGCEYIFPADRKHGQPVNSQTANMAIKRMGYGGRLVAHGLRSLASTTLNEAGFHPDIIESSLAHEDKNSVRRAYNRANYLDKRHEMMIWWSSHIEQCFLKAATSA